MHDNLTDGMSKGDLTQLLASIWRVLTCSVKTKI